MAKPLSGLSMKLPFKLLTFFIVPLGLVLSVASIGFVTICFAKALRLDMSLPFLSVNVRLRGY